MTTKAIPVRLHPAEYESKWQKKWEEAKTFSPDLKNAKKPYYNLMMFPYPSAEGLHVGNMYAFTGVDVHGRFKRMQGYDVFEPIGLDGFGIHSENYALKVNKHPKEQAKVSEANFYRQLRAIGNGFDWEHHVETYDPNYYKWTQWIFIQMFKHGLAYRSKAEVNWCPGCKTVLADEQVIDGKCERTGDIVIKKDLEQWFFRITEYVEELLQNTYKSSFNWPNKVKIGQQKWIGKKEGINITYKVEGSDKTVTVWTSRPDTNFGATFIVISPEHPDIMTLTQEAQKSSVENYIKESQSKSKEERLADGRKKTGAFTGSYAINALNGYKMPIWVSDFVLMDVGTGAVVGVPGHDLRDFEFASAFKIPIVRVVVGTDGDTSEITDPSQVQELSGKMINSQFLDGLDIHTATQKMLDHMEAKGWGKRETHYHLRNWLISRQRYWGAPIPMIYCATCAVQNKSWFDTDSNSNVSKERRQEMKGWFPVEDKDLPVLLPDVENWRPTATSRGPLAGVPSFYETKCPNCGGKAERETDVCDTFLDSSWYFLRYPSTESSNEVFDKEIIKKWLPVTSYIGGAEHTVLHLLYARFVWMALKDWGYIDLENEKETDFYNPREPFQRFFAHGLIIKDGAKMSKSKGNVVVPDQYIGLYGADTLRTYLMFLGPFEGGGDFRDTGIAGMYKWLSRVNRLVHDVKKDAKTSDAAARILAKTIKGVTDGMERLLYNTAIARMMECTNWWMEHESEVSVDFVEAFLKLLAPFAPFMTEELFQKLKGSSEYHSIHHEAWPIFDASLLHEDTITVVFQINGKLRDSAQILVKDASDKALLEKIARESKTMQKWIEGKEIKKVIVVPGKLVNFVI